MLAKSTFTKPLPAPWTFELRVRRRYSSRETTKWLCEPSSRPESPTICTKAAQTISTTTALVMAPTLPHPPTSALTSLWDGIIYEDEDRLLRVELDPLADHVDKLAWRKRERETEGARGGNQKGENLSREYGRKVRELKHGPIERKTNPPQMTMGTPQKLPTKACTPYSTSTGYCLRADAPVLRSAGTRYFFLSMSGISLRSAFSHITCTHQADRHKRYRSGTGAGPGGDGTGRRGVSCCRCCCCCCCALNTWRISGSSTVYQR